MIKCDKKIDSFFERLLVEKILQKALGNDWNVRCSTPVGDAGSLRPRRLAEEAQVSPHGKRASWSGNRQSTYLYR